MKTYFTFLQRNKLFTFVNVIGLSISLMFLLLITHMVTRQLTVDKDMKDADRTYVLANEIWAGGHILLGDKLQSRYPEIEDWCAVSGSYEQFVKTNDQPVNIQMMFVRENFFRFFNFHLLEGNPETLLANENNIVLTRSCAIKLFGTEHALGKTLIEQAFGDRRCTVSGIIEDIDNSIFPSNIEAFSLHKNVRYVNWSASEENTHLGNAASCDNLDAADIFSIRTSTLTTKPMTLPASSKNSSGFTNMIPLKRYYSSPYTSFTSPIHWPPEPYSTNIA